MRRFLGIALLLLGLSNLVAAEDQPRPPLDDLRPWKMAFVRGNDIWVSKGDGTGQKLVIENGQRPSWSPDRSRIAFVRHNNIWMAEADGSKQRPITSQWKRDDPRRQHWFLHETDISWHPTNDTITFSHREAFTAKRVDGAAEILLSQDAAKGILVGSSLFDVGLKGEKPSKAAVRYDLFEGGTSFFFPDHGHPAWSRSGKRLAFTRNGDIWIAETKNASEGEPPPGWEVKRIAAIASYDEPTMRASRMNCGATRLSWHPNERHLAYSYDRLQGSGFNEVHLLDTESGTDAIIAEDARDPCFSPDGKYIVYWAYREANCGTDGICICTASWEGKEKRRLVPNGKEAVW